MTLDPKREVVALMTAKREKAPAIAAAIGMSVDTVYLYQREEAVQLRKAQFEQEMLNEIRAKQSNFVDEIFKISSDGVKTLHEIINMRGVVRCGYCKTEIEVKCPGCGKPVDITPGLREQVAACKTAVDSSVNLIRASQNDVEVPHVPSLTINITNDGKE